MSNPLVRAFFVGRAVAEVINEQLESALTDFLSEFGKFDAEQRQRLRDFTDQVIERADREAEASMPGSSTPAVGSREPYVDASVRSQTTDLQAMIDDLRAEIARLRAELQSYRNRSTAA